MTQRWDLRGQLQRSETGWEPAGGLLGAITLVVDHGEDLARVIEDPTYASPISLPLASRPSAARPARESATTTTVMARTAR